MAQPDIIVICDPENLDEEGRYKGIPSLVVEVVSSSNRRHDMVVKMNLYMETGIKEYWLADPASKQISICTFDNKDLKDYKAFVMGDVAESYIFQGLKVNIAEVFGF